MGIRTFNRACCCVMFAVMLLCSSCSTKQRAINDLRKFSYELRDNSAYYDIEDWKAAVNRFADLRENVNKHEYTADEYRTIGQLEGECATYMVKGAKEGLINRVGKYAGELEGILEGIFGELGND
ncbi:MAG: hypothetical protein SOZ80_02875 [Prevotella sp.]|uniref:hypothetical protein n=1 Tax=Prevotella sp. TaxID=59823 RepID=UPI002A25A2F1|nr:hypothetical protein [Prevotella sp.]MDD7318288.1 hypothetical protein [Prevotellaceae bacterium]MDY4019708.1 hypothetical protein [Prevotella sp.]